MIYPQSITYALEALRHLARTAPGTFIKAREISSKLDIPEAFLGKVLTVLVRRKILVSQKGPSGGVALATAAGDITVQQILQALDAGDVLEDRCVLGLRDCSDSGACLFHRQWSEFKTSITAAAKATTLEQLAES